MCCRPCISFHAVGTCHQTKLARSLFSESCHVWMTAVLWQVVLIFLKQLSPGMVEEEIVTDALSSGFSYLHRMARITVLACRSLSEILETFCTEKPTNQVVLYNLNLEMGQSCFKDCPYQKQSSTMAFVAMVTWCGCIFEVCPGERGARQWHACKTPQLLALGKRKKTGISVRENQHTCCIGAPQLMNEWMNQSEIVADVMKPLWIEVFSKHRLSQN